MVQSQAGTQARNELHLRFTHIKRRTSFVLSKVHIRDDFLAGDNGISSRSSFKERDRRLMSRFNVRYLV